MRTRIYVFFPVTVALWLNLCSMDAFGHSPQKSTKDIYISIDAPDIIIEQDTEHGEMVTGVMLIKADTNRDGEVSGEETNSFLTAFSTQLISNIKLKLNGEELHPEYESGSFFIDPVGHLKTSVRITAGAGDLKEGVYVLHLSNRGYDPSSSFMPSITLSPSPNITSLDGINTGSNVLWKFYYLKDSSGIAGSAKASGRDMRQATDPESRTGSGTLKKLVHKDKLTPGFILAALIIALGLGATHALSPGHGKTMVAAYLVGSKGRIRDAFFLGLIVTTTHVISVIILGVVALVLTEYFMPDRIYPWIGFFSGTLVFCVGTWMLLRRLQHTHHSHHNHEHDHSHDHQHNGHSHVPEGGITPGALLSLGISGGMVPCPSALVVLLSAIAIHRVAFGLVLIVSFSIGLAAVLITIGILTVTAARLMNRAARENIWIQRLPLVSSVLIMVIGIGIAITALVTGGIITITL